MNSDQQPSTEPEWARKRLRDIEAKIEDSEKLQRDVEALKKALKSFRESEKSAEENELDLLSLIVAEASKGINIAKRFPRFFQKLLENEELREVFLDLLALFEEGDASEKIPASLKDLESTDLEFLNSSTSPAKTEQTHPDAWRVHWLRTIRQLQDIIAPSALVSREDVVAFDDFWVTFLRDEVEIRDLIVAVVLEGVLNESAEQLDLVLKVAVSDSASHTERKPNLRASLNWGEYDYTARIEENGVFSFPALELDSVFNIQKGAIIVGFELILEIEAT